MSTRPPVDYLHVELSREGDPFTLELRIVPKHMDGKTYRWSLSGKWPGGTFDADGASSFEEALAAAELAADRLRGAE